jgi:elongation factor G
LLDEVVDYLPSPVDMTNVAIDNGKTQIIKIIVLCNPNGPLLALAFKLEEGQYGQLTYMRFENSEH